MTKYLAIDIGGANLKLANGLGYAASWPFALWKTPELLTEQLNACLKEAPAHDCLVVTMTGELADCFATKQLGVQMIVDSATGATPTPTLFYQTTGQFVSAAEACQEYLLTAASNWHALASFAARYCRDKPGVLLDVGSTTADIIPLTGGREAAQGHTDWQRLAHGELVYSGVERTPLCAVVSQLPWHGRKIPIARELFATTVDVYLLLADLPEDAADRDTADGQPRTQQAAHTRLARMICADSSVVTGEEVLQFARSIQAAQLDHLQRGLEQVLTAMPNLPEVFILSGHGEFLARRLLARLGLMVTVRSLNEEFGPAVSRCAPAHALAVLASDNDQC